MFFSFRLVCRCIKRLDKLAAGNTRIYKQFSLENYGECWSSRAIHHNPRQLKKSNKCVGEKVLNCNEDIHAECAGIGITSFIYQIKKRAEFIPDHCRRVTRMVCSTSAKLSNILSSASTIETSTAETTPTNEIKNFSSQINGMGLRTSSNHIRSAKSTTGIYLHHTESALHHLQTLNTGGLFTPGKIPRYATLAPTLLRPSSQLTSKGSQHTVVKSGISTVVYLRDTIKVGRSPQTFNTQGFLTVENIRNTTISPLQSRLTLHITSKDLETTLVQSETATNVIILKTGRLRNILSTPNMLEGSTTKIIFRSITPVSQKHRHVNYQSTIVGVELKLTKPEYSTNSSLLKTTSPNQTLSVVQKPKLFSSSKTLLRITPTYTHGGSTPSAYKGDLQKILRTSGFISFTKTSETLKVLQERTETPIVFHHFHSPVDDHATKMDLSSESRDLLHYNTARASPESYEMYRTPTMDSLSQSYDVKFEPTTDLISNTSRQGSLSDFQTADTLGSNHRLGLTYVKLNVTSERTKEQASLSLSSHTQQTMIRAISRHHITSAETGTVMDKHDATELSTPERTLFSLKPTPLEKSSADKQRLNRTKSAILVYESTSLGLLQKTITTTQTELLSNTGRLMAEKNWTFPQAVWTDLESLLLRSISPTHSHQPQVETLIQTANATQVSTTEKGPQNLIFTSFESLNNNFSTASKHLLQTSFKLQGLVLHSQQTLIIPEPKPNITSAETATVHERLDVIELSTQKATLHHFELATLENSSVYKQIITDTIQKFESTSSILLRKTTRAIQTALLLNSTKLMVKTPWTLFQSVSTNLKHSFIKPSSPTYTNQRQVKTLIETVKSARVSTIHTVPLDLSPVSTESPRKSTHSVSKHLLQPSIKLQTRTQESKHQVHEPQDFSRSKTKHADLSNLMYSGTGLQESNKSPSSMQMTSSQMLHSNEVKFNCSDATLGCRNTASSLSCNGTILTVLFLVRLLS